MENCYYIYIKNIGNQDNKVCYILSQFVRYSESGNEIRKPRIINKKGLLEKHNIDRYKELHTTEIPRKFIKYGGKAFIDVNIAEILLPEIFKEREVYNFNENFIDCKFPYFSPRVLASNYELDRFLHLNLYVIRLENSKKIIRNCEKNLILYKEFTGKDKISISTYRIGQKLFKKKLLNKYNKCAICDIDVQELLIASHIKPWKDSDGLEKINFFNGLLLCPNHDKLFDKGLISFKDDGTLIINDEIQENLKELNLKKNLKISFFHETLRFIFWHRENIFNKKDKTNA